MHPTATLTPGAAPLLDQPVGSFTAAQKLLLGADFEQDIVASDAGYSVDSRDDVGVFGLYQGSGPHTEVQLSVRHDHNQQFGDHATGSAQYAYRFSDALRVSASYGTAFKAPTFNDLYFPFYGDPNPTTGNLAQRRVGPERARKRARLVAERLPDSDQ